MKRIAYVLKGYPRVSETFIAQEIYLLEQQGFNIEIISMRKAREPQRQPIVDKIKAPITYIPEYIGPAWRSFLRSFLYVTRRSPFRSLFWSSKALIRSGLNQNMSPIKRFLQATWICEKKDLLGKNPSALHHLHSHFVHTPTELTFFISKLTQIPYSISAHAKDIYTISLDEIRERVNHSRLLMTCTGYNVEFLKKIPGIAQNRIYRVYHGIDLENFKRKSPL